MGGTEAATAVSVCLCGLQEDLASQGFDGVVMATGVLPRKVKLPGSDHAKVVSYVDVLRHNVQVPPQPATGGSVTAVCLAIVYLTPSHSQLRHSYLQVGKRVAIMGAGGIGFDVAEFLLHDPASPPSSVDLGKFLHEWGIDGDNEQRGGLSAGGEHSTQPFRDIYLMQRKKGKLGKGLGKTTGWIHRTSLKNGGVTMLDGVEYVKVDDQGLHIRRQGKEEVLDVDHVIVCAGQEPLRELEPGLKSAGVPVFRIGGSELAAELDAKRAIDQGTRLAAVFEDAKPGDVFMAPISWEAKLLKTFNVGMG